MKEELKRQFERASESGKYVRLQHNCIEGLDRLKRAYGMLKREQVLAWLIQRGVEGLDKEKTNDAQQ